MSIHTLPIIHDYLPQLALRDRIRLHATLIKPAMTWEHIEFLREHEQCSDEDCYRNWLARVRLHADWHGAKYRCLRDCRQYYDTLDGILLLKQEQSVTIIENVWE